MADNDLKQWLENQIDQLSKQAKLGSQKGKELLQEFDEKFKQEKANMDTETRRKVRAFWIGISVVALLVGLLIGYALWG